MAHPSIEKLMDRRRVCWEMARVYLRQRDAHGLHDMGVEIQALDRAIAEVETVLGIRES